MKVLAELRGENIAEVPKECHESDLFAQPKSTFLLQQERWKLLLLSSQQG